MKCWQFDNIFPNYSVVMIGHTDRYIPWDADIAWYKKEIFISRDVRNLTWQIFGHVNFKLLQTIWESISTFAGKILVEHRRDDALSSFLQETLMEKMENSIVKICKYLHTHVSKTILWLSGWNCLSVFFLVDINLDHSFLLQITQCGERWLSREWVFQIQT